VQSGYVLGFNKCGYIDRALIQPTAVLKPGSLDFNGTAHQPLTDLISEANKKATAIWHTQQ
jgi:hypothetical protein